MDTLLKSAKGATAEPLTDKFEGGQNLQLFINRLVRVYSATCERFKGKSYDEAMKIAMDIMKNGELEKFYSKKTCFGVGEYVTVLESLKWTVHFVTKGYKKPIYLATCYEKGKRMKTSWNCILVNPPIGRLYLEEARELGGPEIEYGNVSMTLYEVKMQE